MRHLKTGARLNDIASRFRWAADRLRDAFDKHDSETFEKMLGELEGIRAELAKFVESAEERAKEAEDEADRMSVWAVIGSLAGVAGATAAVVTLVFALI